jgi:hypothetical protein
LSAIRADEQIIDSSNSYQRQDHGRPVLRQAVNVVCNYEMTVQNYFDETIQLLKRNESSSSLAEPLLNIYNSTELTFFYFEQASEGTKKEHLLDVYETRYSFESLRKDNPHVIGYETLLPRFRSTTHQHICISNFSTTIGTFIVFSDFHRTELIGILLSKTTIQDTRGKMDAHKQMVESSGQKVIYDYSLSEKVFVNGQFQGS